MSNKVIWFMEPLTTDTNTVLVELKKGNDHDTDFGPVKVPGMGRPVRAWQLSFHDINLVMSDKSRHLKFELYKQDPGSDVITRWEKPRRGDTMKMVLPLISMEGGPEAERAALNEILKISRRYSSAQVSYVPVYAVLHDMMTSHNDIDQLQRGFKTVYALLLRGAYDEVTVFGDKITSGMQKIIMFATCLGIPVRSRTEGARIALSDLLG